MREDEAALDRVRPDEPAGAHARGKSEAVGGRDFAVGRVMQALASDEGEGKSGGDVQALVPKLELVQGVSLTQVDPDAVLDSDPDLQGVGVGGRARDNGAKLGQGRFVSFRPIQAKSLTPIRICRVCAVQLRFRAREPDRQQSAGAEN